MILDHAPVVVLAAAIEFADRLAREKRLFSDCSAVDAELVRRDDMCGPRQGLLPSPRGVRQLGLDPREE